MSIDPRTVKELLQLQVWNKTGILSSNGTAGDDDGMFAELLNELMAKQDMLSNNPAQGTGISKSHPVAKPSALHSNYVLSPSNEELTAAEPSRFEPLIQAASRRFGIDSSLVKAVIHAESSFNPKAVSSAGAKGLMQLMDSTGEGMGVTDPFDPAQNIEGGTRYLSRLLAMYGGSEAMALAAYNGGPARLARLGIGNDADLQAKLHLLPEETQQYVGKVLRLKTQYEA
ncbi:lytic transglycosylase domain-containing protein [Paenibacillus sp. P26]|nr:lytic transglycosylase domain-containing protein [Paenibacillus sp. P26]UUZ96116.1 lytic transglycosylase domain-containing protein [Paenibacillus sp. P25]